MRITTNKDLTPSELLTLMEAFSKDRTAAHIAEGKRQPLDQTELLLEFRDWIATIGPDAARALLLGLRNPETLWAPEERIGDASDGATDSREAALAALRRRISEALADFEKACPGSGASVVLSYTAGTDREGQAEIRSSIEITANR